MEHLLQLASQQAQQAEVWSTSSHIRDIGYEDGKLVRIETSLQEGVSLRIIRDGRIGNAFTTNLRNPEELVRQAVRSSAFGGEAPAGALPATRLPPQIGSGVAQVEALDVERMAGEAERYRDEASRLTRGTINVSVQARVRRTRILNSSGADLSSTTSSWDFSPRILFDGTCAGVGERVLADGFQPFSREDLEFACMLHRVSSKTVSVATGRMPVILMPEAAFVLIWRLMSAADATNLYQSMTPYAGKTGHQVASELITFGDDPNDPAHPTGQPFDDEGTQAAPLTIIERGVFRAFFTDLLHAEKVGLQPNGRSFRGAGLFGSDRLSGLPRPYLPHPVLAPGMTPFSALSSAVDRALVVFDVLGGHSGNIPNGDFSIGIASGFLVEKGEFAGRVKDVMLTGNIHDLLPKVLAVGDKTGPSLCGFAPPILFDDVAVAVGA